MLVDSAVYMFWMLLFEEQNVQLSTFFFFLGKKHNNIHPIFCCFWWFESALICHMVTFNISAWVNIRVFCMYIVEEINHPNSWNLLQAFPENSKQAAVNVITYIEKATWFDSVTSKQVGDFSKFLWPFQKTWTLE